MSEYPEWVYYPVSTRPPDWVGAFLSVVADARPSIESKAVDKLNSNSVLSVLRPKLVELGYQVEAGKKKADQIRMPVLFGDQGKERVAYHVDAVNEDLGIVVEIEAGRGARGNAVYRDLVRASLVVEAKYLILGVMIEYRHKAGGRAIAVASYRETRSLLDALFASGRLGLPFEGVLLFGY